jgi:hypothetical protein
MLSGIKCCKLYELVFNHNYIKHQTEEWDNNKKWQFFFTYFIEVSQCEIITYNIGILYL